MLSAAPSRSQWARADHRLYGVRDGADACSAADWAALAKAEIAAAHDAGRLPILVGGTGLYLRTLLDGIAPIPPIDPQVRADVRGADVAANHARLRQADPAAAARLNPADSLRVARALEVVLSTERTLADWQDQRTGGIAKEIDLRPLILLPPRDWLYARCDARFERMIEDGALEEVRALLGRQLDPKLPVMSAIGVREISAYLNGDIERDEALARGQQATRNYAKRQYTWFARQPPASWPRFSAPLDIPAALELLGPSA